MKFVTQDEKYAPAINTSSPSICRKLYVRISNHYCENPNFILFMSYLFFYIYFYRYLS